MNSMEKSRISVAKVKDLTGRSESDQSDQDHLVTCVTGATSIPHEKDLRIRYDTDINIDRSQYRNVTVIDEDYRSVTKQDGNERQQGQ